jgi:hypothetical protein
MAATRYPVTDVIIETPRYGGTDSRVTGASINDEHDIIGHGWAEIEDGSITVAVHPRGAVGMIEPKERRTYPLADITSWGTSGDSITFGVGKIGVSATNGAEAPIHLCQMACDDADAAQRLTEEARAAGLRSGGGQPFHSGL